MSQTKWNNYLKFEIYTGNVQIGPQSYLENSIHDKLFHVPWKIEKLIYVLFLRKNKYVISILKPNWVIKSTFVSYVANEQSSAIWIKSSDVKYWK